MRAISLLLTLFAAAGTALAAPPARVKLAVSAAPEKARPGESVELRIDCEVERGWHIYSPDFKGTGRPTQLELGSGPWKPEGGLRFPEPRKRRDELLDEEVRYLEGKFRLSQPVRLAPDAPPGKLRIAGKLSYQACTESICDPLVKAPVEAMVEVLPAGAAAPKTEGRAEAEGAGPPELPGLDPAVGGGQPRGAPSVSFTVTVEPEKLPPGGRGELVARYKVPEGYYIYAPGETKGLPTKLVPDPKLATPAGEASTRPAPKEKEAFGERYRILEGEGEIRQPFVLLRSLPQGKLTLPVTVEHMVCDDRQCIQPELKTEASVVVEGEAATGLLGLMTLALLTALVVLLMPCTYPMIPLTITFFTKQASARGTGVLPLALAYGAGIVVDFVLIGLLVGTPIVAFAQHAATNAVFAALFIVFGLSMLGLFELRLPASVNALAGRAAGVQGYLGVFLLGSTLVITSFTCSAPFIGVMLAGGAAARSVQEVVVGMTVFGLVMALPFVALALFPNAVRSLPRSGEWMHTLKVTLGFIELAAALKFVSNVDVVLRWGILPQELFFYIIAAIGITTALYLFGVIRLRGDPQEVSPLRMAIGTATLIFAFYCVHLAPLDRLGTVMAAFAPPYKAADAAPAKDNQPPGKVGWIKVEDDFEGGLARARAVGKLALINWTADTRVNCRAMERSIFPRPDVLRELEKYVEVRLHTDRSERIRKLQEERLNDVSMPIYEIVDPVTGKTRDLFKGADIPPIGDGSRFRDFLSRNAR